MSNISEPEIQVDPRRKDFAQQSTACLLIAALVAVFLFALRSPTILFPHELNVDESQMLSQGMKFLSDPVPWRSVDGTSGGPLNSYAISILLLTGLNASYQLAHVLATALGVLLIVIAYITMRQFVSHRAALWGILPLVYCLGMSDDQNFLHYSSELLPSVFLAVGFWFFVAWLKRRRASFVSMAGLALGLSVWCKLQAAPVAGALFLLMAIAIIRTGPAAQESGQRRRRIELLYLGLGSLLPAAATLGVTAATGALGDFWRSYILGNLAYAGEQNAWLAWQHLGDALRTPELLPLITLLSIGALLPAVRYMTVRTLNFSTEESWIFGGSAVWLAAALFAICRPAQFFAHYTIFLLTPLTYLGVGLVSRELGRLREAYLARLNVLAFVGVALLAGISVCSIAPRIAVIRALYRDPEASERIAAVVQTMNHDQKVRSLAIWGWTPGVYVLTGIPPATRDAIGHFVITRGPLEGYFRRRFLSDLQKAKPDLFVDTVSRGTFLWTWTEVYDGYESDAGLRDYIAQNYFLANELTLVRGTRPIRFYRRRDSAKIANVRP